MKSKEIYCPHCGSDLYKSKNFKENGEIVCECLTCSREFRYNSTR
jgi:hypothetical protein